MGKCISTHQGKLPYGKILSPMQQQKNCHCFVLWILSLKIINATRLIEVIHRRGWGKQEANKGRGDIFLTLKISDPLGHLHLLGDISLRPGLAKRKHNELSVD